MKLFIGLSASSLIDKKYYEESRKFLNIIMKNNDLVFGGCKSGLMSLAYDITKESNNKVIGICPERYKNDFLELSCDREIITDNISSRTNELFKEADALIFLPGGIGTIQELFSAIEFKRCHEFDKPIVIYNINNYFDKLLMFLDNVYQEKFARLVDKELYLVSTNIEEIKKYLNI